MATPVINQPQVAILDVEAIVRRPVVVTVDGIEQVAIRPICVLGLSWDHRALDGVVAAQFLGALRARLQAGEGGADEE
jgi:pyruvate/2-oxoglutarate dehydrogenase complex dihydrolipoamide acyltransferase (E2) component